MAKDLDGAFLWLCLFLSQLVAVGIAHRQDWSGFALYLYAFRWLYLPADGWCVDEPTAQNNLMDDVFNTENESFMQETRLMENEYSVKSPYTFLL